MLTHYLGTGGAAVGAVVWLIAFAIKDDKRFRRFLVVVGIAFLAVIAWWLAHGGWRA